MIAGIMEGSPDAIAVAVVRLECGCRKMAAIDKNGDPASKLLSTGWADSVCVKCKEDNGSFHRVTEAFIDWATQDLDEAASVRLKSRFWAVDRHRIDVSAKQLHIKLSLLLCGIIISEECSRTKALHSSSP